jgi:hypothetical protein
MSVYTVIDSAPGHDIVLRKVSLESVGLEEMQRQIFLAEM